MSISSKEMKKIKECKNLESRDFRDSYGNLISTTMFCKLKNKRTYLRECYKCEHKSNMSIVDCYFKKESCLDCWFCDKSWNRHFEEGIVYCHHLNKPITINSRCEYYCKNKGQKLI